MYEVDPLNGFGYPREIEGLYPLHMTLFYASNKITDLAWIKTPPPKQLECTLTMENFMKWVVTRHIYLTF